MLSTRCHVLEELRCRGCHWCGHDTLEYIVVLISILCITTRIQDLFKSREGRIVIRFQPVNSGTHKTRSIQQVAQTIKLKVSLRDMSSQKNIIINSSASALYNINDIMRARRIQFQSKRLWMKRQTLWTKCQTD